MLGENFDFTSEDSGAESPKVRQGRSFLGVQFNCCGVYARVYINATRTAYVGNCPRCIRRLEFRIAEGGTDTRFFTAY